MRAVAECPDVYNRVVAANLRVVEKFFPEFITIQPRTHCGQGPLFAATLTSRGLEFITPKKVARSHARAIRHTTIEARA
jgi:hypothetical protein